MPIEIRPPALNRPTARPAPKRGRGRRWLRRVLVSVAVLGAVGLAGFTWFAYWPFEGRVGRVEALVPIDVDFLHRTSWRELRATRFLQRNLVDDPVLPELALDRVVVSSDARGRTTLADALGRVPEQEAEINDQLPPALRVLQGLVFGSSSFRVEQDLVPDEVVVAGRWCAGGSPQEGLPRAREVLILSRVSAQVKFAFEAVRHEFVRSRAVNRPDLEITATSDGLLRVQLLHATPPRRPQTCEGGGEMAPFDVWWVARVKDVIALSNAEDLALKVKGVAAGESDSALVGRDFEMERPEGGLASAMDLVGLRSYLTRYFASDGGSDIGAFVGKFLAVDALETARATVTPLEDGVAARATIGYAEGRLREFRDVAATYDQPRVPVTGGIARLLPAKDTALVLQLSAPPKALLRAVFDVLPASDRKLVGQRVAELSAKRRRDGLDAYDDVPAFLDDLAGQLAPSSVVAVARASDAITDDMYQSWYSDDEPDPAPVFAIMARIREGGRQEEVDAFLASRMQVLGALAPEPVTTPEGIQYSRIRFVDLPRQYRLYQPAFKVHDGYFVLATREAYLLEILRVMKGGPEAPESFVSTPAFRETARYLPSEATLALHVDADALRAVAWDLRNPYIRRKHDDQEHALRFRARRMAELARARGGRADFAADKQQVDEEVAAEMVRFRSEGYQDLAAAYRAELDASRRVAAFGFALAARPGSGRLEAAARLLWRGPGPPP